MGMGEPLANLDRLLPALDEATQEDGLGVSARRITISTVGLPTAILRLADERARYHLAVSLHAPTDRLRDELVPTNRGTGIRRILAACDRYFETSGRRLTFEYVLLADVNDRAQDCAAAGSVAQGPPCVAECHSLQPRRRAALPLAVGRSRGEFLRNPRTAWRDDPTAPPKGLANRRGLRPASPNGAPPPTPSPKSFAVKADGVEEQKPRRTWGRGDYRGAIAVVCPRPGWTVVCPRPGWTVVCPRPGWTVVCPRPGWTVVCPRPGWTVVCPRPGWTVVCRAARLDCRLPAARLDCRLPAARLDCRLPAPRLDCRLPGPDGISRLVWSNEGQRLGRLPLGEAAEKHPRGCGVSF